MYDKCYFCLDQLPKLKKESTASFFVNFGGAGVQKSQPTLLYLLLGYEVLGTEEYTRRIFGGSTGWLLAFDKEQDSWQFRHEYYPHLTLTMEDKDQLPVGLHSWLAANNSCTLGKTTG